MKFIRKFTGLLVSSGKKFAQDDALKLSASLSYYTIFAMGPLVLIVISLAGIFYGKEAIQGKIFGQIKGLVGSSAAYQLQTTIANIEKSNHSIGGAIIGFIILLIGATGVFTEIQGSINYIWSIKVKPEKGWLKPPCIFYAAGCYQFYPDGCLISKCGFRPDEYKTGQPIP